MSKTVEMFWARIVGVLHKPGASFAKVRARPNGQIHERSKHGLKEIAILDYCGGAVGRENESVDKRRRCREAINEVKFGQNFLGIEFLRQNETAGEMVSNDRYAKIILEVSHVLNFVFRCV